VSGLPGVKWMSWTACDSGVKNGPWTLGGGEMTCDSFPNCASRNIAEMTSRRLPLPAASEVNDQAGRRG